MSHDLEHIAAVVCFGISSLTKNDFRLAAACFSVFVVRCCACLDARALATAAVRVCAALLGWVHAPMHTRCHSSLLVWFPQSCRTVSGAAAEQLFGAKTF